MARLLRTLAFSGIRKSDGTPNSSGKVWAIPLGATGTGTLVPIYGDPDGLIPLAQPLTLDAGGRYQFAYARTPFKLISKDVNGIVIGDPDRYDTVESSEVEVEVQGFTGTILSGPEVGSQGSGGRTFLDIVLGRGKASFGGDDWQYQARNAVGAPVGSPIPVWRALSGRGVDALSFGALGDNANDDTTALQSAIDYTASIRGVLRLAPGRYRISDALRIPSSMIFSGSGPAATSIIQTAALKNAIEVATTAQSVTIIDLGVLANGLNDVSGILAAGHSTLIRNVVVGFAVSEATDGFMTGITVNGDNNRCDGCVIQTRHSSFAAGIRCTGAFQPVITGGYVQTTDGSGVAFGGFGADAAIFGLRFGTNAIGGVVQPNTVPSPSTITVIGCPTIGRLPIPFVMPGTSVKYLTQVANSVERNTLATITSGATYTPDLANGTEHFLRGTTTGSAYVIAPPINAVPSATTRDAALIVFHLWNNAGAAVTGWNFSAAAYRILAVGISTVDTEHTTIAFRYDAATSLWREAGRSVTPN